MLNIPLFRLSTISAVLCVILGAFGAHSLKKMVSPEMVATFETGVRYQFYHTLALFVVALLAGKLSAQHLKWAARCFIIGIILFSGSLYMLTALQATHTIGLTGIGILTPIGGLFFISGWLVLAFGKRAI